MQNYCTAVDMCNLKREKNCISNKSQRTGTAEVVYGFGKVGDERFC